MKHTADANDYFCLFCRRWTWQATCPKCQRPTQLDAPQKATTAMTAQEQNAALAKLIFG